MKTVRRLYFYAVGLISLEVVLWGSINLLRSIIDQTVGGGAEALAQALALILVGLPIFLFHWLWTQRVSARDEEEKTASLRALFLYAVLIGTLIPVVQNLIALINRNSLEVVHVARETALVGGSQTLADNLIAIAMNGIVALYFWNIVRAEWKRLSDTENFADVRRLYHYIWILYSLIMVVFGLQQILYYLFNIPSDVLGEAGRATLINGLALSIVGTPIWFYSWHIVQASLTDKAERESNLRLGFLYLLALGGVISVLTTAAMLINIIISKLLGAPIPTSDFIPQIGGPISIGVPLGAVWAYYSYWLNRHIESIGNAIRQSGMKHVYQYILSTLGLGATFTGVALLIKFLIDILTGNLIMSSSLRAQLAAAIALIVAWLPLWLATWIPLKDQALIKNDIGDDARRSSIRKVYLYLALFAGVIGGMTAAVALIFELFKALFTGQTGGSFPASTLNDLQLLILFAILLVYHLSVLRRDGVFTSDALAAKQKDFPILVFDSSDGFAESMQAALSKDAPHVPVTISSEKPQAKFNALVMSGVSAIHAPEWIRSFSGSCIIVPNETQGIVWVDGIDKSAIDQASQIVRQLAEGQEIRQRRGKSSWRIVIYVAAALFGLQVFFLAMALIISAFVH